MDKYPGCRFSAGLSRFPTVILCSLMHPVWAFFPSPAHIPVPLWCFLGSWPKQMTSLQILVSGLLLGKLTQEKRFYNKANKDILWEHEFHMTFQDKAKTMMESACLWSQDSPPLAHS